LPAAAAGVLPAGFAADAARATQTTVASNTINVTRLNISDHHELTDRTPVNRFFLVPQSGLCSRRVEACNFRATGVVRR
jgi:hypothetical protein